MKVFADAVGLDGAVCEDETVLAVVERDFVFAFVAFAVRRVQIEETFDNAVFENGFLNDFAGVIGVNFGVDDAVRFDADEGTHLAESLASALGDVVGAGVDVVGGVVFEVDFNLLTGSFEFIHEGFTDFKGTVCDASCTAADDDSAGDFSGFRFVIADAFFDVGGSEFCHYATSLDSFACLASSSSMILGTSEGLTCP